MSDLFHIIENAQAILRCKGVFHQKKLFRRGDRIYAQWGSGFIRIGGGDATSCPGVSYESLDLPEGFVTERGKLGEPLIPQRAVLKAAA